MTIKVAKDGYAGARHPSSGLMLIGGVLHYEIHPVGGSHVLWAPVRSYDGPVEHVDTRGKPVSASTTEGSSRG